MTLLIPLIKSFVFDSPASAAKRFIFPSGVYLRWRELVVREHEIMIFLCPFLHCKTLSTEMYKRYINSIIIIIIIIINLASG